MSDSATYSVIVAGEVQPGFSQDDVHNDFARLFKLTPEKAAKLLGTARILKKDLDQATAEKYRQKLEAIGLVVTLRQQKPPAAAFGGLSLEPMEGKAEESEAAPAPETAAEESRECPKCGLQQAPSLKQCEGCGFQLGQLAAAAPAAASSPVMRPPASHAAPTPNTRDSGQEAREPLIETGAALPGLALLAGFGAAFLCALVWKGIAMTTGYEFGWIAWGIGAAIGVAVAVTGGRGSGSAIACGAFALLAIMWGKYMIADGILEELGSSLNDAELAEEWQYAYQEELAASRAFAELDLTDQSRRQFMVDWGYSEALDPEGVSDEEITNFRVTAQPRLYRYAESPPTIEDWHQDFMGVVSESLTVTDLMRENLGLLDLVFLFLGVGTAFRLGRGVDFG